jgi:alcohol dehydrogenase class IV
MQFNLIANLPRFSRIAFALGEKTTELTLSEAGAMAVRAVQSLIADVGMPSRLRDLGVKEELLDQISKEALVQLDRPANPRKNSQAELRAVLQAAY